MPDSTDELRREYERRFQGQAAYRRSVWTLLVGRCFQKWVPEQSRVLDLGCGWGEFINQITAAEKFGMDLNPDSPQKLSPDVKCLAQDCSATWELPDNSLDVVFTSNFFEHLPDKPALRRTLEQAARCLRPGGRMICLGPNIKCLPGAYWDFWDHYLPLTEKSLSEILDLTGFMVEKCVPRFLPYSMSQGFAPPLLLLKCYLSLPLFWPVFGKQFLVIATNSKPA